MSPHWKTKIWGFPLILNFFKNRQVRLKLCNFLLEVLSITVSYNCTSNKTFKFSNRLILFDHVHNILDSYTGHLAAMYLITLPVVRSDLIQIARGIRKIYSWENRRRYLPVKVWLVLQGYWEVQTKFMICYTYLIFLLNLNYLFYTCSLCILLLFCFVLSCFLCLFWS